MKRYNVSFKRKAVYNEEGYLVVEASNISSAKKIAIEMLENGCNPGDYDGDVTDIEFIDDTLLPDSEVELLDVEQDDFMSEYESPELDEDEEDEYEDEE